MKFDIARARRETPGSEHVVHLNNAGAALMPSPVLDATVEHLRREAAMGGYEAAAAAAPDIEHTYDALAELVGCKTDEIAVVENATRAWDMAFYAIPFEAGDRILTAQAEYASNYIAFLQAARQRGVSVEAIPNDEYGQFSVAALRASIDDKVKLIAVSHVPTNGGLVNPAAEIGVVAREAGITYLLDACQSVGQLPIDVNAIGCDIMSATGRKYLRGPRGTGFLYVRSQLIEQLEPPFLDLHAATWTTRSSYAIRSDAKRFETWEGYVAGKIGLGVAASYALQWGLGDIRDRVVGLAATLRDALGDLPKVVVHDIGQMLCGIVTFTVNEAEPRDVQAALRDASINVSVSPREYTLLDMESRGLEALVRASVHYYNTEEELMQLVSVVSRL